MRKINKLDKVKLKDERIARIFEIKYEGTEYEMDVFGKDGEATFMTVKHSDISEVFERPKYNDEQKRALAAGCIFVSLNESAYVELEFNFPEETQGDNLRWRTKTVLEDFWGVYDGEEAVKIMDYLSKGEGHTPTANDIYSKRIMKTNFKFVLEQFNDEDAGASVLLERIRTRFRSKDVVKSYKIMLEFLQQEGFDKSHIKSIDNFSAWDYGRCGIIGRYAAAKGYITEEVAMNYMIEAGRNAAKDYENWSDYIAAYFLGRALTYGNDGIEDYRNLINGFVNRPDSAFNQSKLHF